MASTRKARGLRLSDECMAKLMRLRRATGFGAYQLVEAMVADVYQGYREDPEIGPALAALERADAALAEASHDEPDEAVALLWPQRRVGTP